MEKIDSVIVVDEYRFYRKSYLKLTGKAKRHVVFAILKKEIILKRETEQTKNTQAFAFSYKMAFS